MLHELSCDLRYFIFVPSIIIVTRLSYVFCDVVSLFYVMQEKEDPDYAMELRKLESAYEYKRQQMQIYFGRVILNLYHCRREANVTHLSYFLICRKMNLRSSINRLIINSINYE